ncbi:MAG: thiamine-phosphate kinase [Actinobacteria bacterium]|nr:thiamine-phosphate kinase [Actinomycetota bacterium]
MSKDHRKGTVSELGETGLLKLLSERLPVPAGGEVWGGDDTAVLERPDGRLLVTVDTLVEGFDFDLSYASGSDVGWKALAANASDIAAMCGRPAQAVTSLALPRSTPLAFVDDFITGLIAAADHWGIALVGGDISEAPTLVVSITLLGAAGDPVTLRSGAVTGDAVYVTGSLGGAAAGLVLLGSRSDRDDPAADRLRARQLRPEPRLEAALWLAGFEPTAMIDLSDGLAVDLSRLLDSSDRGCHIEEELIPIDPDVASVSGLDPLTAAVTGGEDFELLFTVDGERELPATSPGGIAITKIGQVTDSGTRTIGTRDLGALKEKGWDHLR